MNEEDEWLAALDGDPVNWPDELIGAIIAGILIDYGAEVLQKPELIARKQEIMDEFDRRRKQDQALWN